MLGGHASQIPDDRRKLDPNLWTVFRLTSGTYVYAPPGETCPGKFVCQATDRESAQRTCRNRARDEQYGKQKPKLSPDNEHANRPHRIPAAGPLSKFFRCGHPRSAENTYRSGKSRKCKKCQRAKAHERYHGSR